MQSSNTASQNGVCCTANMHGQHNRGGGCCAVCSVVAVVCAAPCCWCCCWWCTKPPCQGVPGRSPLKKCNRSQSSHNVVTQQLCGAACGQKTRTVGVTHATQHTHTQHTDTQRQQHRQLKMHRGSGKLPTDCKCCQHKTTTYYCFPF